jgi:ribose transport system substrate-binding protein
MRLRLLLGFGLLFCCLGGLLSMSGCKGGDGGKGSASAKRVIILINGDSPYWNACRAGMEEAEAKFNLKDAGLVAVFESNDGTASGQLEKLRQFASQSDIAAIGISPIDANNVAIADELRTLKKKGVQVITIDSDVDREKFRDVRVAYLGTDNFAGGQELGKCLRGLLPKGGSYVSFVGVTGAQNAVDRIGGTKEGAGAGFKSLDTMADGTDRSKAKENVRNAISSHPTMDALVGIWSYNAPAIVDTVKELGVRDKFKIVVFDAEPLAIEHMNSGMIDAMVVQNPFEMGYQGIKLMKALVKDDKATIKEMLPKLSEKGGDIIDTGLRVVVPNENSPLKLEMFDAKTKLMKLSEFRDWLAKYKLKGS